MISRSQQKRLQSQLAWQVTNNAKHPEQLPGELFFCNVRGSEWDDLTWATKRKGKVAYDSSGTAFAGAVPVFVQVTELEAAGIDVATVTGQKPTSSE